MERDNKIQNKNVETYAEDMARVIEGNTEEGLIKRIIHEEEAKETEKKNLSLKSHRNQLFLSISVLFVLAALGTFFIISTFRHKIETVELKRENPPLIFLDSSAYVDISNLTKEKIVQVFINEINQSDLKVEGVEGFYPMVDKRIVGLREFNTLIKGGLNIAEDTFVDDNFLIGVANGTSKHPFILIKGQDFPDLFRVMRAWEGKVLTDIGPFFGQNVTTNTKYLLSKSFEDTIVSNKNARVLKDDNGTSLIMYVFVDNNSVVIANDYEAIKMVKERLAAGVIKK